jgi:hypothetical protein
MILNWLYAPTVIQHTMSAPDADVKHTTYKEYNKIRGSKDEKG